MGHKELVPLSTTELAARVVQLSSVDEPQEAGWRPVLELMTSRVASTEPSELLGAERNVYDAHDRAVGSALRSGELDERAAVVRRVNLLVALASRSPDQSSRNESVRQAWELVLENVPLTLDETHAMVASWQELPVEDIHQPRHLKNLLGPLATLPMPLAQSHGTLQPWIELLPSLP